jgi:hypothetical protein
MPVVDKVFIKLSCRCNYLSVINILDYDRKFPIACARCGNTELSITGKTITGGDKSDGNQGQGEGNKVKQWERKYNSIKRHI